MFKRLKELAGNFNREVNVYRLVLRDPRTPWTSKALLGTAVAYALSPIDLIPDFIPVLGHLDDLIVIPLLVWVALRFLPKEVLSDCRLRAGAPKGKGPVEQAKRKESPCAF